VTSPVAITPGAAIAARRRALGETIEDVVKLTGNAMNQKLLSRLENNHVEIQELRVVKLAALLSALRWQVSDLEKAAGIDLNLGEMPEPSSPPPAPATPSGDRRARFDLERSVDVAISKMRDELKRMDEHLAALEAEVEKPRLQ
jgi:transcriptional regulator with XRE-family HTH domain